MSATPRARTLALVCALAYGPSIHALALEATKPVGAAYYWLVVFVVSSAISLAGLQEPPLKRWRFRAVAVSVGAGASAFAFILWKSRGPGLAVGSALTLVGVRPLVEVFWDERRAERADGARVFAIVSGAWVLTANVAVVVASERATAPWISGLSAAVAGVALAMLAIFFKGRRTPPSDNAYRTPANAAPDTSTTVRGLSLGVWLWLSIAATAAAVCVVGVFGVLVWWLFLPVRAFG